MYILYILLREICIDIEVMLQIMKNIILGLELAGTTRYIYIGYVKDISANDIDDDNTINLERTPKKASESPDKDE